MPRGINQFDEDRLDGLNFGDANSSNIVSPGIVTDGIAFYVDAGNFNSYPISGTTWYDLIGNGNNGTLTNGPTYVLDGGGAIDFDGTDDIADFGSSSLFVRPYGSKSFTVTTWARFDTANSAFNPILSKMLRSNQPTPFEYILGVDSSKKPTLLTSSAGTAWVDTVVNEILSLSTWYYFCAGFDSVRQVAFLSINAKTEVTAAQTGISTTSHPFRVGYHPDPPTYMNGTVALVVLYDRALTPTEVAQNFNATRARFNI